MQNYSFPQQILQLKIKIDNLDKTLNVIKIKSSISDLGILMQDEKTWQDHEKMSSLSKQKAILEKKISSFLQIKDNFYTIHSLSLELPEEEMIEFKDEINEIEKQINEIIITQNFRGEHDTNDAFLELNSGAGGTESQDWTQMLVRMYSMWAEANGFDFEISDFLDGEEAGFKSAIIKISGEYAYGWLKNEIGVHRLVRLSPFNANAKRQTSFASVFSYPIVDDNIKIEIAESDIKIDTYRASGAGGQHVNKTDSAVRITHIPSGIVVACQAQRSQIQNKSEAMKMLKSKLFEREMKEKMAELDKINSQKSDISFGSQIRNYVLHPYQLVKDTRSGWETQNAQGFLDGKIKECMESVIMSKLIEN